MPTDSDARNIYKFTVSPHPTTKTRISFTPASPGEVTLDITLAPSPIPSNSLSGFTVAPQPNTNTRLFFTPVSSGEITIDIMAVPAPVSISSSGQLPPLTSTSQAMSQAPPQYFSHPSTSGHTSQMHPHISGPGIRTPNVFIPQGVRNLAAMAGEDYSETEPESDDLEDRTVVPTPIASKRKGEENVNPVASAASSKRPRL